VRYRRGDLALEISLVLSYMGEEYVAATVVSGDTGPSRRTQIGSGTAHTGYQMRRALDRQAAAVRKILHEQMPLVAAKHDLRHESKSLCMSESVPQRQCSASVVSRYWEGQMAK
jgi:hypothetical protein